MNLLQKRHEKGQGDGRTGALVRRRAPEQGIAPLSDPGRQMSSVLDRVWREFDRDPIRALRTLSSQAERLAEWPPIDVAEDDKSVTFRVDVPGLKPEDVNVELSGNLLTIQGRREDEWTDNGRGVRLRERMSGTFSRTLALPPYVDGGRADATYQNGTLTITIPKVEGKAPRRVAVTSS